MFRNRYQAAHLRLRRLVAAGSILRRPSNRRRLPIRGIDQVIECLEGRALLSAVALPTIHLNPDADTGRSNSDNIVSSLTASDFVISGGSITGLDPSALQVATEPVLLEDGSDSPDFSEGRHAYTAQMVVELTMDVAGAGGGLADNITVPVQFVHSSDVLIVTIDGTVPDEPELSLRPSNTGLLPDPFLEGVVNNPLIGFQGLAEGDAIVRLFVDGELDGLTLVESGNGNDAFADGQWSLSPTLSLNDTALFGRDGLRVITATAEDRAGNISEEGSLNIFVDTQGPLITRVDVNDQNNSYDVFSPKPSTDGPTPPVSSLVLSVQDSPPRSDEEASFLYAALWEPIAENGAHYVLRGDHGGVIPIAAVDFETVDDLGEPIDQPNDGEPAYGRITLTFDEFLPDDRYTLTLSDALVDPAGNALDGGNNASGPHETPVFPSGDGQPGGDFVARFTIDSRPEIGVIGHDSVSVDINGNRDFDPNSLSGADAVNHDLAFDIGIQTDAVFSGQFNNASAEANDGFDRLGAYGMLNGTYRWLLDFDNNGVPDNGSGVDPASGAVSLLQLNAVPFSGEFDANHPGEEIGFFTGRTWYFDSDGDNNIGPEGNINTGSGDTSIAGDMQGRPIIGDFDGDGIDDLGTHLASQSSNRFYFDLTTAEDGTPGVLDGTADDTIEFGFPGVLEKPFAADLNLDGIDDIGLMVPNLDGDTPTGTAEWYFLISNAALQSDGTVASLDHPFSPDPLGNDLFAQFGSNLGLPLIGNFDPPVANDSDRLNRPQSRAITVSIPVPLPQSVQIPVGFSDVAMTPDNNAFPHELTLSGIGGRVADDSALLGDVPEPDDLLSDESTLDSSASSPDLNPISTTDDGDMNSDEPETSDGGSQPGIDEFLLTATFDTAQNVL